MNGVYILQQRRDIRHGDRLQLRSVEAVIIVVGAWEMISRMEGIPGI